MFKPICQLGLTIVITHETTLKFFIFSNHRALASGDVNRGREPVDILPSKNLLYLLQYTQHLSFYFYIQPIKITKRQTLKLKINKYPNKTQRHRHHQPVVNPSPPPSQQPSTTTTTMNLQMHQYKGKPKSNSISPPPHCSRCRR